MKLKSNVHHSVYFTPIENSMKDV